MFMFGVCVGLFGGCFIGITALLLAVAIENESAGRGG